VRVNDHEGSNCLALQLVLPIVVGRVDVVADLDVRIAGCDLMVEVTFVTLLYVTQGLDDDGDLPTRAGHELAFASWGLPILQSSLFGQRSAQEQISNHDVVDPP